MLKKRNVVENTEELKALLSNVEVSEGDVLFRSDQYLQIGCDLRDLEGFDRILSGAVDLKNCKNLLEKLALSGTRTKI